MDNLIKKAAVVIFSLFLAVSVIPVGRVAALSGYTTIESSATVEIWNVPVQDRFLGK